MSKQFCWSLKTGSVALLCLLSAAQTYGASSRPVTTDKQGQSRESIYLKGKAAVKETRQLKRSEVIKERDAIIARERKRNPVFDLAEKATKTLSNTKVDAISILGKDNPDNVKRVERIISESKWNYIFPERSPEYTYLNFLKGIGKYPALCQSYPDRDSDAICRRALATMFAHFTQETGGHVPKGDHPEWQQGLVYVREVGWNEKSTGGYGVCSPDTWQGKAFPCGKFPGGQYKSYFGRGAKQLSYNFNYGFFSLSIYDDVRTLLDAPQLVADTWLNLASAAFFYVYPQPPKPNMLSVMDGTWVPNSRDQSNGLTPGFGVTTMIINGGVECGGNEEIAQSRNRIKYFKAMAKELGVTIPEGEKLGCAGMKQFDSGSSAAINIFWEEDWNWNPSDPDGISYRCQLVSYQTAYNAFIEGDYIRCLTDKFDVVITDDVGGMKPFANAGSDIYVRPPYYSTSKVTLNGNQSKGYSGPIKEWAWEQVDLHDKLLIEKNEQSMAAITVPSSFTEKEYEFQLGVTDSDGQTSVDKVKVIVLPHSFNPDIRVVINGNETAAPGEQVNLSANITKTNYPDKDLKFKWSSSGNVKQSFSSQGQTASFIAPATSSVADVYIGLVVQDNESNEGSGSKVISIEPATGDYPAWKEGVIYPGGYRVSNNGVNYECLPFPRSGWCGQSASHYKPGEGSYWRDAWKEVVEK